MSILMTESFARWIPYEDSYSLSVTSGDKTNPRRLFVESLGVAGLMGSLPNWESGSYPKVCVGINHVNPAQNALHWSPGTGSNQSSWIAFPVTPVPGKATVYGMSIYLPPDWPTYETSSYAMLAVLSTDPQARGTNINNVTHNDANLLFAVCADRKIRNDVLQSNRQVPVGTQAYLEARVDGRQLSVWMDDVLVYHNANAPIAASHLCFVFQRVNNIPSTWSPMVISNIYALAEDGIAPSQRLGPTTRVIGTRPSIDVETGFNRPDDEPSNAAVVAQPLQQVPPKSLQTARVGTSDFYKGNGQLGAESAAMVHAITVKAMAANLDSTPHAFQATLRHDGLEDFATNAQPKQLSRGLNPWGNNVPRASVFQEDGTLITFGSMYSVYSASPDTDYSQWKEVYIDRTASSGYYFTYAHRMPDGRIMAIRYDGYLTIWPASTGGFPEGTTPIIVRPSYLTSGETGYIFESQGYTFIASGSRIVRIANDADPTDASNYVSISNTSGDVMFMIALKDGGLRSFSRSGYIRDCLSAFDTKPTASATNPIGGVGYYFASSQSVYSCYNLIRLPSGRILGALTTYQGQLYSSYSDDEGLSWVTVMHRAQTGQDMRYANYAVTQNKDGAFILGYGNSIHWTADGTRWERQPSHMDESSGYTILHATTLPNGDLLYWNAYGVHRIGAQPFQTWFPGLGTFMTSERRSTVHPATGLPWTPEQAAAVEFGVRISS